ncbi:MAG: hypothetical protein NPIRA05_03530 [Nitrospirales bacterium]|nr:MAG: hypothetical protein NPIRA05_03530 [Nitrospirales bacterium]
MLQDLYTVLVKLFREAEEPFSGLGLLVCDETSKIPLYPLYRSIPQLSGTNLYEKLREISSFNNPHHDGFHIVSSKLELTHVAHYFYPPPVKGMSLDSHKHYGARYFVAQTGSVINGVFYTAVVGGNYGVCIFENGRELISFTHD